MQPPGNRGFEGEAEGERSDLFSVPQQRESLIPSLESVPETPEERRRRRIMRIIAAAIAVVLVVTALLIYLALAHASAVEDAALTVGADGRPAQIAAALDLLEGDDAADDLALRARIRATNALEHGVTEDVDRARELLARIEGDEAAQSLDARVARTYLAVAGNNPSEAAQHVTGMTFGGPFAAEGAHASAVSGVAVGDLAHALETSQVAVERQPEAPRYAGLRARALARSGEVDGALALLDGLPTEAQASPAAKLARARVLAEARRDPDGARLAAQAVLDAEDAGPTEKAWAELVLGMLAAAALNPVTPRARVHAALAARPEGDEAFLLAAMDALLAAGYADRAAALQEHLPPDVSTDRVRRSQIAAAIALDQGNPRQARAALESAGDGARTKLLRARLADRSGEHDRARTRYGQAAESERWAVEAFARLGAMELGLERPDEALAAAQRALEKRATDPDAVSVAVRAHIAKEQTEEAMGLASRALSDHPNDPRLLFAKARVHMAEEQWAEALSTLREATEREEENADLWAALGDAAREEGEADEAKQAYEKALELREQHPTALVGLLRLAVDAEDLERAEQALAAVKEANITSGEVDRPEARYLVLSGAGNRGSDEVRRAIIRRSPTDSYMWRQLGWLQYQAEVFDGAARSFARALNVLDEGEVDVEARIGLVLAQLAMRASNPAERTLGEMEAELEGLELSPYVRALVLAAQARLSLANDRLNPARNTARQALEVDEDNWAAHEILADVVDERSGDPSEHLQAAAAAIPPSVSAKARLALRAGELTDQVCEWVDAYRAAAPRGRYARSVSRLYYDCRRR